MRELSTKLDEVKAYALLGSKDALTLHEVSLLTGLSRSHLYRLTSMHAIPFYRPNDKLLYFSKKEVEKWMLANRQATELENEQAALRHCMKGGRAV